MDEFEITLDNYEDYIKLALEYEKSGTHWATALKIYKRVIFLVPYHPVAATNLAVFLSEEGNKRSAENGYREVIARHPDYPHAQACLAQHLFWLGREEESAEFFEKAFALGWRDPRFLGDYAILTEHRGQFRRSEALHRLAVQYDSSDARLLCNLANFLVRHEKFDEVETLYQKAMESEPENPDVLLNFGVFLATQKRFEEALALYRKGLSFAAKNSLAESALQSGIGSVCLHFGEFEKSEKHFLKALNYPPGLDNVLHNFACLMAVKSEKEEKDLKDLVMNLPVSFETRSKLLEKAYLLRERNKNDF